MASRRPSTGYSGLESLLQPAAPQQATVMAPGLKQAKEWVNESPSVLDFPGENALRWLASLVGVDDPNAQVMGMMTPLEVGPTALENLIAKVTGSKLRGRAAPSFVQALKPTKEPGVYGLKQATIDRLQHLYEIGQSLGERRGDWSASGSNELLDAFGGDKEAARKWLRLWGASSPNTGVPQNNKESIITYLYNLENPGKRLTLEEAQTLGLTNTPSKYQNINAAFEGVPLSGDKVEAMAGFNIGENRLPIDVWTGRGGIGSKVADSKGKWIWDRELPGLRAMMAKAEGLPVRRSGGVGLTNTDIYMRTEDALMRAMQQFDPNSKWHPIWGTAWDGFRAHGGYAPEGGPIDMLRSKGLLDAGAMLDPARLREVLKTKGWKAGAIAAMMQGLGADDEPK